MLQSECESSLMRLTPDTWDDGPACPCGDICVCARPSYDDGSICDDSPACGGEVGALGTRAADFFFGFRSSTTNSCLSVSSKNNDVNMMN